MGKTKDLDLAILGQNIKTRRKARGWDQGELAYRIGMHVNTIKTLEAGKNEGSYETRKAIADLFEVRLVDLYLDSKQRVAEATAKQSQTAPTLIEAGRVLEALGRASPVRRALVLFFLHKDEKYLDELPQKTAQAVRLLGQVP